MVRAIVAGTKTQTRRAIKARGIFVSSGAIDGCGVVSMDDGDIREVRCPYGQPGDRLWVREAWRTVAEADATKPRDLDGAYRYWYEADAPHQPGFGKLRPSMFMPRSASRVTLEITGVRVERLQDISRVEAMAEGCPFPNMAHGADPRQWYAELWESINGPGSWDADPWVWVVEFRA